MLTSKLSAKLANMSFLSSILIVLIHAKTGVVNTPDGQQSVFGLNLNSFLQMFISEGIGRIAVPLFFLMSGYLFFNGFKPTVANFALKYKRRFFSYLIPFVFWSFLTFVFFYVVQSVPGLKAYFSGRHVVDYTLLECIDAVFLNSLNSPLWFLNTLIFLTMFSPIIYVAVNRFAWGVIPFFFLSWIFEWNILPGRADAVLFFTTGAFLSLKKDSLLGCFSKIGGRGFSVFMGFLWGVGLTTVTILLCQLDISEFLSGNVTPFIRVLSKVNIVLGLLSVWFLYDYLFTGETKVRFYKYAFMIFVMHYPIIYSVKKVMIKLLPFNEWSSFLVYVGSAFISISLVLIASVFLDRYCNRFYKIISGNR